jgi:hypothetical protein
MIILFIPKAVKIDAKTNANKFVVFVLFFWHGEDL